jgi:hypothetical protein
MAKITETELRRKLRNIGTGTGGSSGPSASRVGSTWNYTNPVLYLAYADSLTNLATDGTIPSQTDATGFGYTPFGPTGTLKQWRGYLFSNSIYSSGDPTDYIWEDVAATSSSVTYTRYYSSQPLLSSEMGDPDNPGPGITWTLIAAGNAIPADAYWLSEKYSFDASVSAWNLIPIKSKDTGTPLAVYSISGRNKPLLSSTQWNVDTLVAMTAHTGDSYSSTIEFGYGTSVVIEYDDGKQYGLWKKVAGVGAWTVPIRFIDGDLLVNGTINADKLSVNELSAISVDIGVLTSGSSSNGAVVRNSKGTGIYDTGDNLVMATGDLTYWTTTNGGNGLLKFPPATP